MDNENNRPFPHEEKWLPKETFGSEDPQLPILDDDSSLSSGLTSPENMELEQIIQETLSPEFISEEAAAEPENLPDSTQFFTPVSQDIPFDAGQAPEESDSLSYWPEQDASPVPLTDETIAMPVSQQEEIYYEQDSYEDIPRYTEECPQDDPFYQEDDPVDEILSQEDTAIKRKRRPERKKGYGLLGIPHMIATVVWLAIIVAIGVTLGRLVWVAASDMLAFNKTEVSAVIEITGEDDLDDISRKLKDAGLIRYPQLFKMFANLKGGRDVFSNGTYSFNIPQPDSEKEFEPVLYDYNAIIKNLNSYSSSRKVVEDVMIPEGYTCAQIFALLEEKGVCTVTELEEYAANGELNDYWFLEGVERGDKYCLEGYLFPNTYDFYVNDDPERVLEKFLNSFEDNYTDVMKDKLEPLNARMAAILANRGFDAAYIEAHKITIREIVIVASMIEKESTGGLESYKVSSVIYNRLTNPKNFPKLQIDATIIYALGGNIDPETGKTKPLTKADLAIDHPYNRYLYEGLPPGPISNPGATSLNAALDPDETAYYFYVYDPKAGEHIFSKTQEEHEKAVNSVRD